MVSAITLLFTLKMPGTVQLFIKEGRGQIMMKAFNLMEECMNRKPISTETYAQKNRELIKDIQNGDNEAFTEFVLINGRLIVDVIKKYIPNFLYETTYTDDLFQQGVLGLHRAAKTYDCEASTVFSTYAYPWIRGCIFRYIAYNRPIHIPFDIVNKSVEVRHFVEKYRSEHFGETPDDCTICKEIKITRKVLQKVYMSSGEVLSLDAAICNSDEDDKELLLMDVVAAPNKEADNNIIYNELHSLLLSLVLKETKGKQRNYEIVIKHYGLDGKEPLSIKQLSEMYEITYERTRQIIANVIAKLRKSQNMALLNEYIDI